MVNAQDEENPFEIDGIVVKPATANGKTSSKAARKATLKAAQPKKERSHVSQHNTAYCCPLPSVRPHVALLLLNS